MNYKNSQEFVDDCNLGLDIEFDYKGIGYGVFGWTKGGPTAFRKDQYGAFEQQFPTPDQMLNEFKIDGKPLRDIITQVELLLH